VQGLPEAGVITALFAGLVGLIGAVAAVILQFYKLRADRYLVDENELEDLRWWRRIAIGVVNRFLDDYATRDLDPPVDVHKALDYPPDRPKSRAARRRHLDE
jgi:hypothetical protein